MGTCFCVSLFLPIAKTKSRFRQQQKLLKVLQAIESDSAHFSGTVSSQEQVLDPEVSAWASREGGGFHCLPEGRVEAQGSLVPSPWGPLLVAHLASLPSLPVPSSQHTVLHMTEQGKQRKTGVGQSFWKEVCPCKRRHKEHVSP